MDERLYFPLFVDLTGKRILVIGAGTVARRRIAALLPFGARITVVAPEASPEVEELAREGRLLWLPRAVQEEDLDGADLVLAAAGDTAVDAQTAAWCRKRHIPVNTASDRSLCDFYFPGVARRGSIVVGVTASGTDHKAARRVSEAVRELLDREKEC